jgi:hypothetical protein
MFIFSAVFDGFPHAGNGWAIHLRTQGAELFPLTIGLMFLFLFVVLLVFEPKPRIDNSDTYSLDKVLAELVKLRKSLEPLIGTSAAIVTKASSGDSRDHQDAVSQYAVDKVSAELVKLRKSLEPLIGTSAASVTKASSVDSRDHQDVVSQYAALPYVQKKTIETMYRATDPILDIPKIKQLCESFEPKVELTDAQWLNVLLDLHDKGFLDRVRNASKGEVSSESLKFSVKPSVSNIFRDSGIGSS